MSSSAKTDVVPGKQHAVTVKNRICRKPFSRYVVGTFGATAKIAEVLRPTQILRRYRDRQMLGLLGAFHWKQCSTMSHRRAVHDNRPCARRSAMDR